MIAIKHVCAESPSEHLPSFWRQRDRRHMMMCCSLICLETELKKMVHDLEQIDPNGYRVRLTSQVIEFPEAGGTIQFSVCSTEDSVLRAVMGREFASIRNCGGTMMKPKFVEIARTRIR